MYLGGKVDVSLNGIRIPARLLSDDGVTTNLVEGTREINTMAGVVRQSSGLFEEATVTFSVLLESMNYLKNIFPDLFTESNDRPEVAGQLKFGGDDCTVRENTPVVVHYTCDENSDNDVYVPNGSVQATIELVQNATDALMVQVTVNAQPRDEDGVVAILGTGDLDEPTMWNPETEAFEPLES